MWKPSKRIVTWILVILLVYNILTLALTLLVSGFTYVAPRPPPYLLQQENLVVWNLGNIDSWWRTEMSKINNNPQMITVTKYITDYTVAGFGSMWKLSSSNEIQFYGNTFERIGNSARMVETGEILENGEAIELPKYDWLKNIAMLWWIEKTPLSFSTVLPQVNKN